MGKKKKWLKQHVKRITKSSSPTDLSMQTSAGSQEREADSTSTNHALEIAKATAVAADAAAAAAKAAGVLTRLTDEMNNIHRRSHWSMEDYSATKIQAAFRGHLAKKALRALKSVVKLQALFRGYMVRRQARTALHCMETLISLQHRIRCKKFLN